MGYYTVYDPQGEMFEVPASKLDKLVVQLGWTFWHPSENKIVFEGDVKEAKDEPNGTGTEAIDGEGGRGSGTQDRQQGRS